MKDTKVYIEENDTFLSLEEKNAVMPEKEGNVAMSEKKRKVGMSEKEVHVAMSGKEGHFARPYETERHCVMSRKKGQIKRKDTAVDVQEENLTMYGWRLHSYPRIHLTLAQPAAYEQAGLEMDEFSDC